MEQVGLNVTSIDASQIDGSIEVYRIPKIFHVEMNGPYAYLFPVTKDDSEKSKPMKINRAAFDSNFVFHKNNDCSGLCFRKPLKSFAFKMKTSFCLCLIENNNNEYIYGKKGDYLITRSSGINEIITNEEFNKIFSKTSDFIGFSEEKKQSNNKNKDPIFNP
jgi:hypothetical protein